MTPSKTALVKRRRAIGKNVSQRFNVAAESTSIIDALTPALKIIETR